MKGIIVTAIAIAIGSAGSAWADRVIEQPEDAYELAFENVIMPGSGVGTLLFKTCETCRSSSLRVDGRTLYMLNNKPMTFDAFSMAMEAIRHADGGGSGATVYVYFDVKTQNVNRLAVDYLDPATRQDGRNTSRERR
jgi:hypothetical protein